MVLSTAMIAQNSSLSLHPPKREVRAVWVATVNSLDWPPSLDPIEQQRSLKELIAKLKAANFNTIYFQVRSRADAMYRSEYEPWAQQLSGTFGRNPGWDPLAFIIAEAHAQCIEVHPWFNTFVAWTKKELPPRTSPEHIIHRYPEWVLPVNGEWWLDPGIPEVRDYIVRLAMELVRTYDIDGIQFDFIRYPGRPFADDETFRRYGRGMKKDDWRRENINKFIRAFHDSVTATKPMVKIGATPIGIYKNTSLAKGQQSYFDLYQDSRRWLREGWMDYLVPQVYWTLGTTSGDPDFSIVINDWADNTFGRHIYIGIGAYKPEVFDEIPALIDTTRSTELWGNSFFRYENISKNLNVGGRFRFPANIPPMLWKDAIIPIPPENVRVRNVYDGIFQITWSAPALAADSDGAKIFNIYRSTVQPIDVQNPANLLAIISGTTVQFTDTIRHVMAAKYFYAVSALDKGNNESAPATESVIIPEIVDLAKQFRFELKLGAMYLLPASSMMYVSYEIKEQSPVILKILDSFNREIINVVDTIQEPGKYVAGTDISLLDDGTYAYLFVAGSFSQKKIFTIDK